MFPAAFPDADQPIELGAANSGTSDRDETYWQSESRRLRTLFERRIRERVSDGEITHLSVFAIAPQPLLILLGTLPGDIVPASVYQRHREPPTWAWPTSPSMTEFLVQVPPSTAGPAALVLSISATITPDRIRAVVGDDTCIWSVSIAKPHNDVLKSAQQLSQFRAVMRPLLDRIKAAHGQAVPLHIFPAAPISVPIKLGRIRMPKADMSWEIYDQINALGGFVRALSLTQKD
jgi:hypothetical protein